MPQMYLLKLIIFSCNMPKSKKTHKEEDHQPQPQPQPQGTHAKILKWAELMQGVTLTGLLATLLDRFVAQMTVAITYVYQRIHQQHLHRHSLGRWTVASLSVVILSWLATYIVVNFLSLISFIIITILSVFSAIAMTFFTILGVAFSIVTLASALMASHNFQQELEIERKRS